MEGDALIKSAGADIRGGKKGFNLSTDTVKGLPAREKVKVLSLLPSTSKGPTYGGVSGRLTASTLTNTLEQERKEDGTEVLAGLPSS